MRLFQRAGAGADAPARWMNNVTSPASTPTDLPWEPVDNDADTCSLIASIPLEIGFEYNTGQVYYRGRLIWKAVCSGDADRIEVTRRATVLAVAAGHPQS